jgi:hypothetical protein
MLALLGQTLAPAASAQPRPTASQRATPTKHASGAFAAELGRLHRQHRRFDARLERVSARFLGAAYGLSPLGEGPGGERDRDPLVRLDRFDCVTYVEQVMAFSWFGEQSVAVRELKRIRYQRGTIRYGARKHIMMALWIPASAAEGMVSDITVQVAPRTARQASLDISHADFASKEGRALALAPGDRPVGHFEVPIVPVADMAAAIGRVPHGTLITTIREERTHVPYRASHVGLVVVRDGGERQVRHADKRRGVVAEEPLRSFVARAARMKRWPVSGFNLQQIAKHPPSVRAEER